MTLDQFLLLAAAIAGAVAGGLPPGVMSWRKTAETRAFRTAPIGMVFTAVGMALIG